MRGARAVCVLACLALAVTTSAQEGHPLVGSWHGDWGFGAAGRQDLTVVVDYAPDGTDVTGLANPGYDHASLQNIQLTIPKPTDWTRQVRSGAERQVGQGDTLCRRRQTRQDWIRSADVDRHLEFRHVEGRFQAHARQRLFPVAGGQR